MVALAGHAALASCGGDGDRDDLLARDLVFGLLALRFGASLTPAYARQHITNRMKELTYQAEQLLADHWLEIEAEAARLAATQRH